MKLILKLILFSLVLLLSKRITAQQNTLFNTYVYDPLQLNIAYAGVSCSEVNVNYRKQWIGLKDSPLLYQLNAHTFMGKSTGVALRIASQSAGLLNSLQATAGYAYHFQVEKTTVNFGIGLGFIQNTFNQKKAKVLDADDGALANASMQKAIGFDSEIGVMVLGPELKAGFSVLHLYNTNPSFAGSTYKLLPQFNLNLSYIFNRNENVEVEPWLVNRYTLGSSNTIDALLNFNFMKVLTVGAGFRSHYGLLCFLGVKTKNFKAGYSFDYGTSANKTISGSSHQVLLGIGMCKPKKEPRRKSSSKKRKSRARF